jgi:xanthine dehydrogenase YagS FAD-binding subunit
VDISDVVPRGVDGTRIGAGTTLAELEVDTRIPQALREACTQAASPQLRSMGTIGGNLLQATRCWYWRLGFDCWLHGGEKCFARDGAHREHAIFGNERCASAHPSDIAAALLALGATLRTTRRELALADLYRLPTDDNRDVTTLAPDELILELDVPAPDTSIYLKAMDRRKWAFPIVGVAAARFGDEVRIALAGVAPIPWTLESAAALDRATPLPGTAYKAEIARALVRRALIAVKSGPR